MSMAIFVLFLCLEISSFFFLFLFTKHLVNFKMYNVHNKIYKNNSIYLTSMISKSNVNAHYRDKIEDPLFLKFDELEDKQI